MKKLKWFSLIEMLMVISIILVFLVVFQWFFKPKNIEIYYWQKCINELYSFINRFTIAWLTSKWFNSWWVMIYPSSYRTEILASENKIINSISWTQRETVNLSWIDSSKKLCYINDVYNIQLTWEDIIINIGKWSLNNLFDINKSNGTWQVSLLLCGKNNSCITIWQYIVDKRSQTITKRVCLGFSWNDCLQWNQ